MRRFVYYIVLGILVSIALSGCTDKKQVMILNDCQDVNRVADLYGSVDKLGPFFARHEIDTLSLDTVFEYCGYILKEGDRAVQIDTIFTAVELKEACLKFFDIDEPLRFDTTETQYILQ
ncbi:MAG: hypothetical protein R3F48_17015 [Candidatus Zixiibacteriota bacterium]